MRKIIMTAVVLSLWFLVARETIISYPEMAYVVLLFGITFTMGLDAAVTCFSKIMPYSILLALLLFIPIMGLTTMACFYGFVLPISQIRIWIFKLPYNLLEDEPLEGALLPASIVSTVVWVLLIVKGLIKKYNH